MGERYVLGIDSGGTNYRIRACKAADGTVLGEHTGPSCAHYLVAQNELAQRLNANIDACLAQFGGSRSDCAYILCGTSGIDSEEDRVYITHEYHTLGGFDCTVVCLNDAELAHYAVVGGDGLLLISGTGAITYGTRCGKSARVGGWMLSIMGEEGSGSWLSRHALRHLARCLDGVVPEDNLTRALRARLAISGSKQLMDISSQIAHQPTLHTDLGALVDECAEKGDEYAAQMIKAAAAQSFALIADLADVLGYDKDDSVKVGVWGSNIVKSRIHYNEFVRLTKQAFTRCEICFPTISALDGAVRLALNSINKEKT